MKIVIPQHRVVVAAEKSGENETSFEIFIYFCHSATQFLRQYCSTLQCSPLLLYCQKDAGSMHVASLSSCVSITFRSAQNLNVAINAW